MIIRKIQKDDLVTRVEWMNNPRIYSSMHYDIPVLLENTISWWENNQTKNNRTDVVIIENEDIVAMAGGVGVSATNVTYAVTGVIVVGAVMLDVLKKKNANKVKIEKPAEKAKK